MGQLWCNSCWRKKYVIRAVTIPVSGPIDPEEWPEFREALRTAWAHATNISNWAQTTLYASDVRRKSEDKKLAPMPKIYLYGLAKSEYHAWDDGTIDKASAGDILTQVEQKYRSQRYEILWLASRTLSNYRYPQPFPFRPEGIKIDKIDSRICVEIRVAGRRWKVRLAGSEKNRRQLAGIQHLMDNPELMAQGAIYQVTAHGSDNRNGDRGKDNGTGIKWKTRIMLKFVGWFPVKHKERDGDLFVNTDVDSLLVAMNTRKDKLWFYNGDHARRLCLKHQDHMRRLQRRADDKKHERRKPRKKNARYRQNVSDISRKDRNRMTSICHEVSASVVGFAARSSLSRIVYNDSERSFSAYFPWAKLREMIKQKAALHGITFEVAGKEGDGDGDKSKKAKKTKKEPALT